MSIMAMPPAMRAGVLKTFRLEILIISVALKSLLRLV